MIVGSVQVHWVTAKLGGFGIHFTRCGGFGSWVGGVKRLWGIVNFILAICLAMTILITKVAQSNRRYTTVNGGTHLLPPPSGVKAGALALFAVMGIPQAITYSIPFALASIFSNTLWCWPR
ncbi:hypothetical protein NC653_031864 [Populus alba x Populus x berolinensis]|uniref:Uncharacterized protein n=1 Tax=Populus alba x Populus x berolinensis TaxID=444605 RepID=A0AAD6Q384_9ROSI|nr:hypothetical protein NC653_031864 [Populus alba x Populus x berolinensis]